MNARIKPVRPGPVRGETVDIDRLHAQAHARLAGRAPRGDQRALRAVFDHIEAIERGLPSRLPMPRGSAPTD